MYNFTIPPEMMADLWRLRQYAAMGPIARQIREAVALYLKGCEEKIGCPIKEVEKATEHYKKTVCRSN